MLIVYEDTVVIGAGRVPAYLASYPVGAVVPRLVNGVQTLVRVNSASIDNSKVTEGLVTVTLFTSPV